MKLFGILQSKKCWHSITLYIYNDQVKIMQVSVMYIISYEIKYCLSWHRVFKNIWRRNFSRLSYMHILSCIFPPIYQYPGIFRLYINFLVYSLYIFPCIFPPDINFLAYSSHILIFLYFPPYINFLHIPSIY